MRRKFLFPVVVLFFSCNNNDTNMDANTNDTVYFDKDSMGYTIENPAQFKNLIWSPVFDSIKGDIVLKQQRLVSTDTLTADKLIREINDSWEGIILEFRKISNDTIYVAIPESSVLTQQMGSSGAYSYISTTTYILTELPHIKFVSYDFLEGDHLAPGTMKRADFKN